MSEWIIDDYGYNFRIDTTPINPVMTIHMEPAKYLFVIQNEDGQQVFAVRPDGRIETLAGVFDPTHKICTWCGQLSPDDMRGGCLACGGPR